MKKREELERKPFFISFFDSGFCLIIYCFFCFLFSFFTVMLVQFLFLSTSVIFLRFFVCFFSPKRISLAFDGSHTLLQPTPTPPRPKRLQFALQLLLVAQILLSFKKLAFVLRFLFSICDPQTETIFDDSC